MGEAASGDARRQLALAEWCRRRELYDAEKLHLQIVLATSSRDRERNQAMDRLGLQPYGGTFLPKEEIQQLETKIAQEGKDQSKWAPIVGKWRKGLSGGAGRKQRYALEQLHAVKEPAIIPTLESQLSNHGEDLALEVVSVLGNIHHYRATQSLVSHALDLPWDSVGDAAIKQLRRRPLHDYTPLVLRRLVAPI